MPKSRAVAILATAALLTLAGAASAQAHVHVVPEATAAGSYSKLTFRVPDESETASTTKVAVSLPADTPLADVAAQPLAGWTLSITEGVLPKPVTVEGATLTKAPTRVTWTAAGDGTGIAPGQFQEFSLSGGPIPDGAKELGFPVAQSYSDGSVVQWNEPQKPGADEPEHPLPAFAVTPALAGDQDSVAAPNPVSSNLDSGDSNGVAIVLGAAGLVTGLIGAGLGAAAFRRSRQSP
jgi:uncharacterized protein YcnI